MAILSGAIGLSARSLDRITKSVEHLNEKMAVILERISWHQKEIEDHSKRISKLESDD